MNTTRILRIAVGCTWRLGLCTFAYVAGVAASGVMVTTLEMPLPSIPEQANERMTGLCLILGSLALALGLAFYVLVGLYSMIQTYWLAPTLLVLHNLEIFTDSMVYALAIALLLVRGGGTKADELFARFLLCLEQATVEK